jgi:hypothetical protein
MRSSNIGFNTQGSRLNLVNSSNVQVPVNNFQVPVNNVPVQHTFNANQPTTFRSSQVQVQPSVVSNTVRPQQSAFRSPEQQRVIQEVVRNPQSQVSINKQSHVSVNPQSHVSINQPNVNFNQGSHVNQTNQAQRIQQVQHAQHVQNVQNVQQVQQVNKVAQFNNQNSGVIAVGNGQSQVNFSSSQLPVAQLPNQGVTQMISQPPS